MNPPGTGIDLPPTKGNLCGLDQQVKWRFIQPTSLSTPLDILFVVDTSSSMDSKRARVASNLPKFISKLSTELDYQVGVMLGHGGSSIYSGSLYSPRGRPSVLSSRSLSAVEIENQLVDRLTGVIRDASDANGEALMYSLDQSLGQAKFSKIQNQGFYRNDAALALVFVTDENDVCFRPDLSGYSQFPHYVPSVGGIENVFYQNYCVDPVTKTAKIGPASIQSKLRALKMNLPLTLAGVIHNDVSFAPNTEEAIGHGILELVKSSMNGIAIDISSTDLSSPLSALGDHLISQLKLLTSFELGSGVKIQENSVSVTVDGKTVGAEFDSHVNVVSIGAHDAGQSKSIVEVTACKAN
jgi:hypothetical protein